MVTVKNTHSRSSMLQAVQDAAWPYKAFSTSIELLRSGL